MRTLPCLTCLWEERIPTGKLRHLKHNQHWRKLREKHKESQGVKYIFWIQYLLHT